MGICVLHATGVALVCTGWQERIFKSPLVPFPEYQNPPPVWYTVVYWEYLSSREVGEFNFGGGD